MVKDMLRPIYLDHNATTPVAPEALEAMMPYLTDQFGNPSCSYDLGSRARDAVETARKQVASLLGARPGEVIFTSGGTESNNAVLKGLIDFKNPEKCHVITCSTEHPATPFRALGMVSLALVGVIVLLIRKTSPKRATSTEKTLTGKQ